MWRILWQESKSAVMCDDMKAVLISCMQHSIKLLTIVKIRQAECSEICSKKLLILKALLMFIKTLIILPASHVNYIARVKLPSAMSVYLGNTTYYMIQP